MNAVVFEHVPVTELPETWRNRQDMVDVAGYVRKLRGGNATRQYEARQNGACNEHRRAGWQGCIRRQAWVRLRFGWPS